MIFKIFIFLAGVAVVFFAIGCYTRRISLLSASLIFNLANFLAPWTVVYRIGQVEKFNSTTNTTYVTFTYDYLDYTTKVVLSMLFLALTIITILQFWNVVTYQVKRGVETGEEVDRI